MPKHNTVQIYYKEKYQPLIDALRKKAVEREESESKLFLDLVLLGAKERYPEVANGSCEEAGREKGGCQVRQDRESRPQVQEKVTAAG